ncbi:MAG: porin family protein [Chitinophagaceae bacterium]
MKKISLLALLLSSGSILFAQDQPMGSMSPTPQLRTKMETATRFGIKGGVNLAKLRINDDANASNSINTNLKTSFNGGLFVNIPLTSMLRFQPEILYNGQGTKADALSSTDANLAGINEYDFHYISVPMMLQLQSEGGFFVELGPQFSYLSSANGDRTNGKSVNLKDMDYVKKTDFGAGVGLGYLSRIGLGLGGRFTQGFSNVWNNDKSPSAMKNVKYKNQVIQIDLVYHFGAYK